MTLFFIVHLVVKKIYTELATAIEAATANALDVIT